MPGRTDCPACGAPLEFNNEGDVVRCDFCGANVQMNAAGTQPRVVGTPPEGAVTASAQNTLSETIDDRVQFDPLDDFRVDTRSGEPVAPAYASSEIQDAATPEAFTGPALANDGGLFNQSGTTGGGAAVYPAFDLPDAGQTVIDAPATYPATGMPPAAGSGNRNRWIAIGVGVFVVACVACACVAGVIMAMGGGFGGF